MERMITPMQLKKIWAAARELGWDDTRLHAELARVIGATSLRELTEPHARLFIDYQVSEGATSGRLAAAPTSRRAPYPANLIELATPAQLQYVDGLLKALGWTRAEPYFLGALKKATGKSKIRTRRDATMAIVFLEKMVQQRQASQEKSGTEHSNGNTR